MKVLSFPLGLDACSYYRIRKPLAGLEEIEPGSAHVLDITKDKEHNLAKIIQLADVIVTRPGAEAGLRQVKSLTEVNAKVIVDIDDNVDEIDPLSQFYQEYGTEEVDFDGKPLWRDGVSNFNLADNRLRLQSLHLGLKQADYVTVTTPILAKYAKQFNDNVYINRNTIDFHVWWRLNRKEHKVPRIIWQGSPSHYKDWFTIKKPLAKLFLKYDFELYLLGSAYMGLIPKKYLNRVHVLPWVPFEAHSYRMMALEPDFAIIPLEDSLFNHNKSSIKWLEMSAMGIPSVVSNVTPYREVISTKTSIPFSSDKEFYNGVELLLTNRGVRKNLGNAAYQEVKKHHDLTDESKRYYNFICQLLS